MACPASDQLLDFLQGNLPEEKREAVERHLAAGCPRCRRQVSHLRDLLEVLANPRLMDPPEWLLHHAFVLFRQQKMEPAPSGLSRLWAFLVMDNFAESRLLGLRHVGLPSRQLLYRAGSYDIDVLIERSEVAPGVDLMGQVLPIAEDAPPLGEIEVELRQGENVVGTAKVNALGEFLFEGISEGVYDLRLWREGMELRITGLQALLRIEEDRP